MVWIFVIVGICFLPIAIWIWAMIDCEDSVDRAIARMERLPAKQPADAAGER